MSVPCISLRSGPRLPMLGLGTWKSQPGQVAEAVKTALLAGYRHLDCAYAYGNEAEVGQGLRSAMEAMGGSLRREDVFITGKIWNTYHSRDRVRQCLQISLDRLQLDYLDLCLVHWPMGYAEGREDFPKDENGKFVFSEVHFLETWQALEDLHSEGKTRSIGTANFNSSQLQQLLDHGRQPPELNQVECHPFLQQNQLIDFCRSRDIPVVAYSPLGSPDRPWAQSDDPSVTRDPLLTEIGATHGKSAAQVALRWNIQRGVGVIPKSVSSGRIVENLDVFDFQLSREDMSRIASLDRQFRACHLNWAKDHPLWPFQEPF